MTASPFFKHTPFPPFPFSKTPCRPLHLRRKTRAVGKEEDSRPLQTKTGKAWPTSTRAGVRTSRRVLAIGEKKLGGKRTAKAGRHIVLRPLLFPRRRFAKSE